MFLDDERMPIHCRAYRGDKSVYEKENFVVVRNFDEFYKTLKEKGIPKFVSFDYELNSEEDGLCCAEFLKFECLELGVDIPKYNVHSFWPGIFTKFKEVLG